MSDESRSQDNDLTEGQKRRLGVFRSLEHVVSERVEELCGRGEIEVFDVAVLVIAKEARNVFFGESTEGGTSVVMAHRSRLHAFLHGVLPPAEDAPFDPYADLLEPAPPRCIRVLILDDESLTVLSYGTFVTVCIDGAGVAQA